MKTNATMTHFARNIVDGDEIWARSIIPEVQWEDTKGANVFRSGQLEANRVSVYIPMSPFNPTFRIGDVIVRGVVPNEISAIYTMGDLREEFEDVVVIKTVDRFDFGSFALQHIALGGA